jgi:hypothetical protein
LPFEYARPDIESIEVPVCVADEDRILNDNRRRLESTLDCRLPGGWKLPMDREIADFIQV